LPRTLSRLLRGQRRISAHRRGAGSRLRWLRCRRAPGRSRLRAAVARRRIRRNLCRRRTRRSRDTWGIARRRRARLRPHSSGHGHSQPCQNRRPHHHAIHCPHDLTSTSMHTGPLPRFSLSLRRKYVPLWQQRQRPIFPRPLPACASSLLPRSLVPLFPWPLSFQYIEENSPWEALCGSSL
jgi:hypothetical protein